MEWDGLDWLDIDLGYGRWDYLVYDLQNTYESDGLDLEVKMDLNRYSSLKFEISKRIYYDFPDSTDHDEEYVICNAKFNLNLSNNLSLTNGLRYNNYEYDDQSQHVGFFSNFRWQFKPECNLFLGYKLSTDKLNNKFATDYEKSYIKINYLF